MKRVEFSIHYHGSGPLKRIIRPGQMATMMRKIIPNDAREHGIVVLLTSSMHVLGYHEFSVGSINRVYMIPADVYRPAIITPTCAAIMVVHNHPSGVVFPSSTDKRTAKSLEQTGMLLDIQLTDFIIVAHKPVAEMFYSFDDHRLLRQRKTAS